MALWKEQTAPKKEPSMIPTPSAPVRELDSRSDLPAVHEPVRRAVAHDMKESLIAANLVIEGKIDGAGDVRIAGRFKGDVHVQGNLTIEDGAKVTGGVRANTVVIGGELEGNIEDAGRVEVLSSGVINGDVKAGSLTVAAGSRMRGRVEFGWEDKRPDLKVESGAER
jgi:cytoskeletal protein CcmA (bactofilin family)